MSALHGLQFFFFQAEDGIRDADVTGVQTCALPISTRMNWVKAEMALCTNREGRQGALPTVLAGADVFVGFSSGGALSGEAIAGMARDAIVLALALPEPEIRPELAKRNGAAIVATGRADLPNGVNTAMVVPGVFRGLLDVAARGVNDEMKIAAAEALASCLPEDELRPDRILPSLGLPCGAGHRGGGGKGRHQDRSGEEAGGPRADPGTDAAVRVRRAVPDPARSERPLGDGGAAVPRPARALRRDPRDQAQDPGQGPDRPKLFLRVAGSRAAGRRDLQGSAESV